MCDVRHLLNRGVKVALGTDVGGGTHPSILDAIRLTLCASVAACQMNEESSEDKVERCGQDLERAESFAKTDSPRPHRSACRTRTLPSRDARGVCIPPRQQLHLATHPILHT